MIIYINYDKRNSILYNLQTIIYGFQQLGHNILINQKKLNFDLKHLIIVSVGDKIYAIDSSDNTTRCETNVSKNVTTYYKCQLLDKKSTDIIEDKRYKVLFEHTVKICNNIKPLPMFRPFADIITNKGITDYYSYFQKKYETYEKRPYKIVTYTRKHHTVGRIQLYNILNKHFSDDVKIYTSSDFKLEDENKCVEVIPTPSYSDYINIINSGYFMLNMSGVRYSNPLRCADAIISQTCVVSTYIYTDAYQTFPRFDLDYTIYDELTEELEEKIVTKLKYLVDNCDKIYKDLIVKQQKWYKEYLEPSTHVSKYFL